MYWFNFLSAGFLLCLLWAGLLLSRWATARQGEQYGRLRELATLDARIRRLSPASSALRDLDADGGVVSLLQEVLRDDLNRIRALDPARMDVEQRLCQLEDAPAPTADGSHAAVATESELVATQRRIQQALGIFTELYRARRISAGQWQMARDRLQELGIRVTVNSCLVMAQRAVEQADGTTALAYFQRAERLLALQGLPMAEKEQKKRYLEQERARLLQPDHLLSVGRAPYTTT